MIEFLYPQFFAMFLPPLLWLVYTLIYKKRVKQEIFSPEILKKLTTSSGGFSNRTRTIFTLFALFFMVTSLARPVIKEGVVEVESKSVDIVIALDISKSMLAKDRFPNRLDFSKAKIIEILNGLKKNRVGVIAFANNGYTVSPLSFDKKGVEYLVRNIDSKNISEQGTSIERLLKSADMFLKDNKDKLLIIFSDGGDSQNYADEISFAKSKGIKIFVVGVGSEKGSPIELEAGKYLQSNGSIVITKFNPAIQDLALSTGGIFLNGVNSHKDIDYILTEIEKIDSDEIKKDNIPIYKELFIIPLAISLIFLFPIFYSLPRFLFILFIFFPTDNQAGLLDWWNLNQAKSSFENGEYLKAVESYNKVELSDEVRFNIGNSYYKSGNYEKAIENYEKIHSKDLKQKSLYNSGNSYVQLGKLKKAKNIYEKALKLGENAKVRENLEWVKNKLKQEKQKEKNKERNNGQNQKQNKDEKNQNEKNKESGKKEGEQNKKEQKQQNQKSDDGKEGEKKKGETENHNKKDSENSVKKADESSTKKKDKVFKKADENLTEIRDLNKSEKIRIQTAGENQELKNMEEDKILQMLNRVKGGTKIYSIPVNSPNTPIQNPW